MKIINTSASSANNPRLNIAAFIPATRCLGPGLRAAVWVQGCAFHCVECIAPDWQALAPSQLISPSDLFDQLKPLSNKQGLTISGGEPMLQAEGLSKLLHLVRRYHQIDVICYTGYRLEQLVLLHNRAIDRFLDQIDVLIDDVYIKGLNDDRGLRGSSNQTIHFLTSKLKEVDFQNQPRTCEVHVRNDELFFVGIPNTGMAMAFKKVSQRFNQMNAQDILDVNFVRKHQVSG